MIRVLVIDDDQNLRWILSYQLKAYRLEVQSVSNSNEAIRSFEEGDCQEVVAGVNVPAASALTYLQLFKLKRPSIQILVLSGFTAMENDAAAFWFGADDLLEKPFEAETLRARITHWI